MFGLPIVLACAISERIRQRRIIYATLFAVGCIALILTFSRSGLVGFMCGLVAFLPISRWAGLISRRAFENGMIVLIAAIAIGAPLVVVYLASRPEAAHFRLGLIDKGLKSFWDNPLFGSGMNNSTAVMEGGRRVLPNGQRAILEKLHLHYLVILVEDGLIGFILFFGFFIQIARKALRTMPFAEGDAKPVLVGIVTAMIGIAIQNFGDPFQGHVTSAMLWFYCGLVVAIERRFQAFPRPAPAGAPVLEYEAQAR